MKYYYREHLTGYRKVKSEGKRSWGEVNGNPDGFVNFPSRPFLENILPRLIFKDKRPRALELGCGTGPGACFLSERGFQVHGIDLIPTAIKIAREMAEERNLAIHYEVMDVTQMPHTGTRYDLVTDSYCLQGVVLDSDRKRVFSAIRARLKPSGYYLISTAMYDRSRHHPDDQVIDSKSGIVFHRYDEHDIFEPETDILYALFSGTSSNEPDDRPEDYEEIIEIDGKWYLPKRRYRNPEGLRSELEVEGFRMILQTGEYGGNVVCALDGTSVSLAD